MTAVDGLLSELDAHGIRLWSQGGALRYRAPQGALTPDLREKITAHRGELLERLAAAEALPELTPDPTARFRPFPLTDVQQAYLLGRTDAFAYGGVACHGYAEFELPADVDADRMTRAWQAVVNRHDMLRAIVHPDGSQQVLEHVPPVTVPVTDASGGSPDEVRAALSAVRERMAHRRTDPGRWPLHELALTRTGTATVLHASFDLLVADFLSCHSLLVELEWQYAEPEARPPLDVTFRDYVLAERALRSPGTRYDADRSWWLDRLDGLPAAPDLPVVADAPSSSGSFRRHTLRLGPARWGRVREQATARGLSPASAVLACFAEVLGRWSRRPEFTVNVTLLNRLPLHEQVDQLVGDFTSVTLLAVDATGEAGIDAGIGDRARQLQARLWEDLDHRLFSGVEALRELARRRGRDAALMPVVFTSTLGLTSETEEPGLITGARRLSGISQTPQVWLDCQVAERRLRSEQDGAEQGGALIVDWDVRDGVFPPGMVEDMVAAFGRLLTDLADGAWDGADAVPMPEAQARRRAEVNATDAPVPTGLLQDAVLARARETPERTAVIAGDRAVTFAQLAKAAGGVAAALRDAGVRPGERVAVVMDKGVEQPVAALGVLLAGAAYLPVDTVQPPARRETILADAGVRVVLTQSWLASGLGSEHPGSLCTVLAVDDLPPAPPEQTPADPGALAYVIYTSGSTGTPKGVMISHRAALNTVADINARFAVGADDRVLGLAHLGFDLSVYDIFGPAAVGGALVLPEPDRRGDPAHLAELIARHRVTLWNSVPAQLQLLEHYLSAAPDHPDLSALRLAMLSGDWIPVTLPGRVRALLPALEVVSLGGATEAAIWSIVHPIGEVPDDAVSIPYGRPLANQRWHVLDHAMRPRPDWVPGELYIAGEGVALGYLGDEERTAERFLTHPGTGERLYRTGDWGRYRPDGEIEFLGRDDDQVKIRGHRIELAEVEAALLAHPDVGAAAAVVVGDGSRSTDAGRRLHAFVAAASGTDEDGPSGPDARQLRERMAAAAEPALAGRDRADLARFAESLSTASLASMAAALRSAGLFADARAHTQAEIAEHTGALPAHRRLLGRWLGALAGRGWLRVDDSGRYAGPLPTADPEQAWGTVREHGQRLGFGAELVDYLAGHSELLPALLRGEADARALAFPEGRMDVAEAMYRENLLARYSNSALVAAVTAVAEEAAARGQPLRVLEAGAGVGGTSAELIAALAPYSPAEYLFTDVSRLFLDEARLAYGDHPWVRYALYDINSDPLAQGLSLHAFDVVVCANVLHNAQDTGLVLGRLRDLLAPGGLLVFIEATGDHHEIMISKEFLMSFEGGEADDLRAATGTSFLSDAQWQELLTAAGATETVRLPDAADPLSTFGQHVFAVRFRATGPAVDVADLTAHVAARLPEYMVPAGIQAVDALPLTSNGKVDRAALTRLVRVDAAEPGPATTPPADDLERRIAAVWTSLLHHEPIGREDDFFALGGDSLLVARMVGRLREELPEATGVEWEVLLRAVLRRPTVAALAGELRAAKPASAGSATAVERGPVVPLGSGTESGAPTWVLVHEGSGSLAPYRALARELDAAAAGPVVGLEITDTARYLGSGRDGLVEAMGVEYANALRAAGHGVDGEIQLVGYCMGGLVATETARALAESGVRVGGLTAVSCYRIPYRIADELVVEYGFAKLLGADLEAAGFGGDEAAFGAAMRGVLRSSPGLLPDGAVAALDGEHAEVAALFAAQAARRTDERFAALAAAVPTGAIESDAHLAPLYRVFRHSVLAVTEYDPAPYAGDITFLRDSGDIHFLPGLREDQTSYWEGVCLGRLRVEDIAGDHFACLSYPHAPAVARLLLSGATA